jgi:hypothetical protein
MAEIPTDSDLKDEALAIFYRLHIHPDLRGGMREYLTTEISGSRAGRVPGVRVLRVHDQARLRCSRRNDRTATGESDQGVMGLD